MYQLMESLLRYQGLHFINSKFLEDVELKFILNIFISSNKAQIHEQRFWFFLLSRILDKTIYR